jgi:hypothetical protein
MAVNVCERAEAVVLYLEQPVWVVERLGEPDEGHWAEWLGAIGPVEWPGSICVMHISDLPSSARASCRHWLFDGTWSFELQQYYFRQRLGRRLPPGDGLCWFCVDKPAPARDDERVDRRITVQRIVVAAMRSRK